MGYNDENFPGGSVVIDIESVASPDVADLLDPVQAPANYKDPAKIAAYIAEKQQSQIERAALEPDLCEVVAVGWHELRPHDPEFPDWSQVITRRPYSEKELLTALVTTIRGKLCVGFNILNFDLPVLIRRCQLLDIPAPVISLDRYRTPHVDLLERLSLNGRLTYRSLAFYCRRFGVTLPQDVTQPGTGADVAGWVAAGNWEAVEAHCRADLALTTALARKLKWLNSSASVAHV